MPLTRDQVVDAALKVAGDYGLGDVSMRRVATELGVQAGALYWHVANKQELLIAVAQRVLDPAEGAASWSGTPQEILSDFRRRLLSVRDGAEIVAIAHADQPDRLPPAPQLTDRLRSAGSPDPRTGAQNLIRWTLGAVLVQQTAQSLTEATAPERAHRDASGNGNDHDRPGGTPQFERDFRLGLHTLLSGVLDAAPGAHG